MVSEENYILSSAEALAFLFYNCSGIRL